jgi:predicted glutamine amidotransferase
MCQLLGMNCNIPTDICFSFTGFQARGGLTDEHQDGWGIAFFEGRGVRQFLDSQASVHSPIADLVRNYPIKSKNVISHIRKATQGTVQLENTHPFMRELWGYYWIFAHNGNLIDFKPEFDGSFVPVGSTDSEQAFCYLLQELRKKFGNQYPGKERMFEALTELSKHIGAFGEFNFLMSNGDVLFAHCSTFLTYIVRQSPFRTARLKDQEMTVDFGDLTTSDDRVAVIATAPLTNDETWNDMKRGSLWWFDEGEVVRHVDTVPGPEKAEAP